MSRFEEMATTLVFRLDHPRRIDRVIDYFGEHVPPVPASSLDVTSVDAHGAVRRTIERGSDVLLEMRL